MEDAHLYFCLGKQIQDILGVDFSTEFVGNRNRNKSAFGALG